MRRLWTLLLLGALVVGFVGCSEPTPPPEEDTAANPDLMPRPGGPNDVPVRPPAE